MQSKFDELPPELKIEIAEQLPNNILVNLALTSKCHLALFTPMMDVRKLLRHVTRGEHDLVSVMLQEDISLIFKRGKVTDCSGQEFNYISSFEYALWALDKHMWAKMIACIPQNEEKQWILEKLIAQYNNVNTEGVTYRFNGKTISEKYFDFENTIINALQKQLDLINAPEKNWDVINNQWREDVGGVQKGLPMHIVEAYCSDEPFELVPNFTSQPKSSKQFFNCDTGVYENWFSSDSKLSVDFAIYKAWNKKASSFLEMDPVNIGFRLAAVHRDLAAMRALYNARTKDFIDLKSQLENLMTLDNHHQVSQI